MDETEWARSIMRNDNAGCLGQVRFLYLNLKFRARFTGVDLTATISNHYS